MGRFSILDFQPECVRSSRLTLLRIFSIVWLCLLTALFSCALRTRSEVKPEGQQREIKDAAVERNVKFIILNPGHYHAALVQESMYEEVAPVVHVYAPAGPEVQEYLSRIESFNTRTENPTTWQEKVYTGDDYLEKMLAERPGNVVVLSGNNRKKAEYIKSAVDAGINVFSDKPMCIDKDGFRLLEQAFARAEEKSILLYDIMTERFEITAILQKEIMHNKDVFGELQPGSVDDPAVVKESVHHFFKYVSGSPVRRPSWYFDTAQQGEGLVDVTTHMIDLAMWACFPNQAIDYQKDIVMKKVRHWPTMLTRQQYEKVTGAADFPDFLKAKLNDEGVLPYYCNGEMIYTMKDIAVKISVIWNFQALEGAGDTSYSLIRGSKANVIIRQGKEQNYKPELYVEPAPGASVEALAESMAKAIAGLQSRYPGLALERSRSSKGQGWHVLIPQEYRIGHEAHFRLVTEVFLQYLKEGKMPQWEISNMIAKYYITTEALRLAKQ